MDMFLESTRKRQRKTEIYCPMTAVIRRQRAQTQTHRFDVLSPMENQTIKSPPQQLKQPPPQPRQQLKQKQEEQPDLDVLFAGSNNSDNLLYNLFGKISAENRRRGNEMKMVCLF
jgi:hypothetical protein